MAKELRSFLSCVSFVSFTYCLIRTLEIILTPAIHQPTMPYYGYLSSNCWCQYINICVHISKQLIFTVGLADAVNSIVAKPGLCNIRCYQWNNREQTLLMRKQLTHLEIALCIVNLNRVIRQVCNQQLLNNKKTSKYRQLIISSS